MQVESFLLDRVLVVVIMTLPIPEDMHLWQKSGYKSIGQREANIPGGTPAPIERPAPDRYGRNSQDKLGQAKT